MWGNLGNSAMSSATMRYSLSEANINLMYQQKEKRISSTCASSEVLITKARSLAPLHLRNRSPSHSSPPEPPSYPPPPIPYSPSLSVSSSEESCCSPVFQDNVEGHVFEKQKDRAPLKRLASGGARLKDGSSDSSDASIGNFKRGGFQRSSLYRSGRCKSMPSIVTVPATPVSMARDAPDFEVSQKEQPILQEQLPDEYDNDKDNAKIENNVSSSATTPSSGIDVTTPISGGDITNSVPEPRTRGSSSSLEIGGLALAPPSSPRLSKREHQNSQGSNGTTGHERRFKRRFPKVGLNEDLVDHYSCALLSDILLQGVLYISPKFFAFYSNIFGYKKQILIPLEDVVKITKERTAKIIPNAVGIVTDERKYVFGSLLTRDATFKTMYKVWKRVVDPDEASPVEDSETELPFVPLQTLSEQEVSADASNACASPAGPGPILGAPGAPLPQLGSATEIGEPIRGESKVHCQWPPAKEFLGKLEDVCLSFFKLPRTSLMLLISTLLLIILFASASIVIYRITLVHKRISAAERRHPDWIARWTAYQDIQKKQNKALKEEVQRLTNRLKDTIQQLNQIRLPLEDLLTNIGGLPDYCRPPEPLPPQSTLPSTGASPSLSIRSSDNSWLPVKA